jgi:molybdopterin molybdotransferase
MAKNSCYKPKFITYNQSMDILNSVNITHTNIKEMFISDALNYILAEDIIANHNSPEFLTSGMDGYAFKYEDIGLDSLKISDYNPAGSIVKSEVLNGYCIKTFTGALMPQGSDTLIPIENVSVIDNNIVINDKVPYKFATRDIGENYAKNEILITKGETITFAQIGVLASLNISYIKVYSKPIIAVASTGDEILDLGEKQSNDSQIRSSNHLTIEAISKQYGADVIQQGVVKDDKHSILNLIKSSLQKADIVVTTGGVSVGDYDFVKDIIKDELQAKVLFQGVQIKPGQHIIIAQKNNKFIIGLPGFAYSSTVTFILYVLPLIFKLKNSNQTLPIIKAKIKSNFPKRANKSIFTSVNLNIIDGKYEVNFQGKKLGTSAILTNMLGNSGLLMQDINSDDIKVDDEVDVILY